MGGGGPVGPAVGPGVAFRWFLPGPSGRSYLTSRLDDGPEAPALSLQLGRTQVGVEAYAINSRSSLAEALVEVGVVAADLVVTLAGADAVVLPTDSILLDASGSYDPDAAAMGSLTYTWACVAEVDGALDQACRNADGSLLQPPDAAAPAGSTLAPWNAILWANASSGSWDNETGLAYASGAAAGSEAAGLWRLPGASLSPGVRYVFTVLATSAEGRHGTASRAVLVDAADGSSRLLGPAAAAAGAPPAAGTCSLSPASGMAFLSRFQVLCSGFGGAGLSYSFGLRVFDQVRACGCACARACLVRLVGLV